MFSNIDSQIATAIDTARGEVIDQCYGIHLAPVLFCIWPSAVIARASKCKWEDVTRYVRRVRSHNQPTRNLGLVTWNTR